MKTKNGISRVFKVDENLRTRLVAERTVQEVKTTDLIAMAVKIQLPNLVRNLKELGFAPEGETRPIKMELSEEILGDLREASSATGLPTTLLLKLSLLQHCPKLGTPVKKAPKKSTARKAAPKAPATRKAKTAKKKA